MHVHNNSDIRVGAAGARRSRSNDLPRFLPAFALAAKIALWMPKTAHLAMSWGEFGHSRCGVEQDGSVIKASLLAAVTICEVWEIAHHTVSTVRRHDRVAAGYIVLMALFMLSSFCKSAYLAEDWANWLKLPCGGVHGPMATLFFSPICQALVLTGASALALFDTFAVLSRWLLANNGFHALAGGRFWLWPSEAVPAASAPPASAVDDGRPPAVAPEAWRASANVGRRFQARGPPARRRKLARRCRYGVNALTSFPS